MLAAWSKRIMGYTLMAARVGQPPTRVFTLTATLREPPEGWGLAHVGCLKPAYNEIYPDGRPSRPTAYTGFHPDRGAFCKRTLAHVECSEAAYNGIYLRPPE